MEIPRSPPKLEDILERRGKRGWSPEAFVLARRYNERYYHWSKLVYCDTGDDGPEDIWALMKVTRNMTATLLNIGGLDIQYNLTNGSQRTLHELDMRLSKGILPGIELDHRTGRMYSIGSTMEESIASAQIEGASTTTKDAKRMLREGIEPSDRSERMILNNYDAMRFIKGHRDDPLTPTLIKDVHAIITKGTLEDQSYEGGFRTDNSIAVRGVYEDVTHHEPPDHAVVPSMVQGLCAFVNDDRTFIHPVIKGIIIHFMIAYIHPFMDGNGRVSRSLFYWYLLKNGYDIIGYLSISKTIKSHRKGYDEAYLLCETDDNDLTYFIDYNLDVVSESVDTFQKYVERKMSERESVMGRVDTQGLNLRQKDILSNLMRSPEPMDVYEIASRYGISPASARRDLIKLMECDLVIQGRCNHRSVFSYRERRRS